MPTFYNRVLMTTATAGTGTVTLGAAFSNAYMTFDEAGVPNAATVPYLIEDGTDFEYGTGVYTASGTTMTRGTVRKSKIAGVAGTTKITLSGTAVVSIVPQAEDLVVRPSSSTDNVAPRFDGTGGDQIQNSSLAIADTTARLFHSSGAGGIPIQVTNTNATPASDELGYFVETNVPIASVVSLTSGTTADIGSASFPAGNWLALATVNFDAGASTVVDQFYAAVHTVSGNNFPTAPNGGSWSALRISGTGIDQALFAGMRRYSFSSTTPVYIKALSVHSVSTMGGYGYIIGIRIP